VAGVERRLRPESNHGLVAGLFADQPGLSLRDPGQRMEPVERGHEAPCETAQPVTSRSRRLSPSSFLAMTPTMAA